MNVTTNVEHGDFMQQGREATMSIVAGGFFAEAIGGVLGLLAILNIAPMTLMAIAIIVFGASLLLSSGTTYRVDALASKLGQRNLTAEQTLVALAASGIQVLVGIAGIALGIIALVGVSTMTLILVGLLCAGSSVLISGTALSGTVATILQH